VLHVVYRAVVSVLILELVVLALQLFVDQAASTSVLPEDLRALVAVLLVSKAFGVPLVLSALVLGAVLSATRVQVSVEAVLHAMLLVDLVVVCRRMAVLGHHSLFLQQRSPAKSRSLPQSPRWQLKYTSKILKSFEPFLNSKFSF
jgi:hypothetical protein